MKIDGEFRVFQLVGPHQTVQVLGVPLVGVNAENGRKLIITIVFLGLVWLLGRGLRLLTRPLTGDRASKRVQFWTRQVIQLGTAILQVIGILDLVQ